MKVNQNRDLSVTMMRSIGISSFCCLLSMNPLYAENALSTGESLNVVQQQKVNVSGIILDETGQPVIGATVQEVGTTNGMVSDLDGKFQLSVSGSNAVLKISYVGYKTQEIKVGNKRNLSVTLKEDREVLDEVVVVGYAVQKKENLTGAVSQIGGEALESRPIVSVSDGLQGRVPGLNLSKSTGAPGSSSSWNIRGFTGFGGSAAPLILVDGVEMNPDLINPDDIASISVLKDAAASAIYGSRAPYGVVLITTKKGKEGKVNISYTNNFSIKKLSEIPEMTNSLDFARTFNHASNNSQQNPIFTDDILAKIEAYVKDPVNNPSNSIAGDGMWGIHSQAHGNANRTKEYFKSSQFSQNHSLSLRGGAPNGKLNYFASVGYSEDNGLLKHAPKDYFNRYNFSVKVDSKITDWLQISTDVKYSQRKTERPNFPDWWMMRTVQGSWPTNPEVNPDGTMNALSRNWDLQYGGSNKNELDDLVTKASAVITPFKGFSVNANYTYMKAYQKYQMNALNFEVPTPVGPVKGGNLPNFVESRMANDDYQQFEAYMTYSLDLGKHHGKVMLGHQSEVKHYKSLWGKKTDLITQAVPSISTAVGTQYADDGIEHWATEGYFFRFNYNYDSKYLLEFNGRYDASSRFPKHSRWAFFPSVSLGWNAAKESWWPLKDYVSEFKLRGSWGSLGNANVSNYLYLPTMGIAANGGIVLGNDHGNPPCVYMPGIVNPNVTWEKPEVINVGFDAMAFNNRLTFTYEWFQRTIKDQLSPADIVSSTLGTGLPQLNNGETETRGWEMSIGWRDDLGNVLGKPLKYNVKFNVSDFFGYVTKYPNKDGRINGVWTPGQRFGEIRGYVTDHIVQDAVEFVDASSQHRLNSNYWFPGDVMYKDIDGDGKIDGGTGFYTNQGDVKVIGNSTPRYTFGLNLGLEWNNFDLNMFFEGVGKQDLVMGSTTFWGTGFGQWHSSVFDYTMDYWTPENRNAYFPRPYIDGNGKNQNTQTRYMLDGAYVRFKTLQLGYTVPTQWLSKLKINNLRLYCTIENLGILYNASHIKLDPMMLRSGSGEIYPPQKMISFGLNINL